MFPSAVSRQQNSLSLGANDLVAHEEFDCVTKLSVLTKSENKGPNKRNSDFRVEYKEIATNSQLTRSTTLSVGPMQSSMNYSL